MIRIEITDPHLIDKDALRQTAMYLMTLSGGKLVEVPPPIPVAAPVPPPPPIPVAVPVPPPVPVAAPNVELDSSGLPWDARIHSRTKTKTADGKWRYIRSVGPVRINAIESELRGVMGLPVPVAAPVPPPVPVAAPVPPPVPVAAPVPPPVPVAAQVFAGGGATFTDLMKLITSSVTEGLITRAQVNDIVTGVGLPSIAVASSRPDLLPHLIAKIKETSNAAL